MNAKELVSLYQGGERNFSGEDLQGQNFKGQDLSGAIFSHANIRGANFTQANLKNADFAGTNAGLRVPRMLVLTASSCLLSAQLGLSSISNIGIAEDLIQSGVPLSVLGGQVALGTYVGFIIVTLRSGLGLNAGALALTLSVSTVLMFSVALALGVPWHIAWGLFQAVIIAFIAAWAWMWSCAITGAVVCFWTGKAAGGVILFGIFFWYWAWFNGWVWVGDGVTLWPCVGGLIGGLLSHYIGRQALRENPKFSIARNIAVSVIAFGGTSFRLADLTEANFFRSQLTCADFRSSKLVRTNWFRARGLSRARLGQTILSDLAVRELVTTHDGAGKSYVDCNLEGANLEGANLSDANLTGADLRKANLRTTLLERANLTRVQALETDFHLAKLTGACLESWNIDGTTQLEGALCDFVYLLNYQQERRPNSGTFEVGEFAKLFAEVTNTVDLIFREGLNWRAFAYSFQQIEVENEDAQLEIRSVENRGEGVIVVRVNVAPHANKAEIHSGFMQNYALAQKALESQYRERLEDKDKEINRLFSLVNHQNEQIGQLPKLMAETPKYDLRGAQFAGGFAEKVEGDQIGGTINNPAAATPSLAEAAAEIQDLLKQLEASNPTATETEQTAFLNVMIPPTKRDRFISALKSASGAAIEEIPYGSVLTALVEGWSNPHD